MRGGQGGGGRRAGAGGRQQAQRAGDKESEHGEGGHIRSRYWSREAPPPRSTTHHREAPARKGPEDPRRVWLWYVIISLLKYNVMLWYDQMWYSIRSCMWAHGVQAGHGGGRRPASSSIDDDDGSSGIASGCGGAPGDAGIVASGAAQSNATREMRCAGSCGGSARRCLPPMEPWLNGTAGSS